MYSVIDQWFQSSTLLHMICCVHLFLGSPKIGVLIESIALVCFLKLPSFYCYWYFVELLYFLYHFESDGTKRHNFVQYEQVHSWGRFDLGEFSTFLSWYNGFFRKWLECRQLDFNSVQSMWFTWPRACCSHVPLATPGSHPAGPSH